MKGAAKHGRCALLWHLACTIHGKAVRDVTAAELFQCMWKLGRTPKENMSDANVKCWPRNCSGLAQFWLKGVLVVSLRSVLLIIRLSLISPIFALSLLNANMLLSHNKLIGCKQHGLQIVG